MFMGEYQHSIDAKGRLIVPAKFRDGLGEHFVVTKGLDNCLFAYPQEEWKIFEEKLKQLPLTSTGARKFVRFFFAGAAEVEPDRQGRVVLPAHLREYAGLERDVTIAGVSNRAEIWDTARWEAQNELLTSEAIAGAMDDLGF